MEFTNEQIERYSRHIILKEVGGIGQKKIRGARVLIIGAGGLGSPSAFYLTAAGVGKLGLVDNDVVELSNLQRQILHTTTDLGRPKIDSAEEKLLSLNPEVQVITHQTRIQADNILKILDGYDIVVEGSDNFPTKFLVNDACVFLQKPLVTAGILQFYGQIQTILPGQGPCYRCVFPYPPPAGAVPSCQEAGVLGVVPGIIGTLQALEVLKWITEKGELLSHCILKFDALSTSFRSTPIQRNQFCPICGENPIIRGLIDYDISCNSGKSHDTAETRAS